MIYFLGYGRMVCGGIGWRGERGVGVCVEEESRVEYSLYIRHSLAISIRLEHPTLLLLLVSCNLQGTVHPIPTFLFSTTRR